MTLFCLWEEVSAASVYHTILNPIVAEILGSVLKRIGIMFLGVGSIILCVWGKSKESLKCIMFRIVD